MCGLGAKFGPNSVQKYVGNVVKNKKTGIINRFYSYFAWGMHLMKQDVVVVQTSECKCEAFIARNNTFEEC